MTSNILILILSVILGAGGIVLLMRRFAWIGRLGGLTPRHPLFVGRSEAAAHAVTERIRSVGKIVGLEVVSKEIATQTRGLNWLPPVLLSKARLAMIFHFEKQYFIDLELLAESDVRQISRGCFAIRLPEMQDTVRLIDVIPYDIQAGRLLGLVDVFRFDAATQRELMAKAQAEAQHFSEAELEQFHQQAQSAIRRQLTGLFQLVNLQVEVYFADSVRNDQAVSHASESCGVSAEELQEPRWSCASPSRRRTADAECLHMDPALPQQSRVAPYLREAISHQPAA